MKWLEGRALSFKAPFLLALIILACAMYLFIHRAPSIMPLDDATFEEFQAANSRAVVNLHENSETDSLAVESSLAFRMAVIELGYDPDKTLPYWMSPQFKRDVAEGDPKQAVTKTRRAESLLATALGDGSSDEERATILAHYSDEVRNAFSQQHQQP